MLVGESRSDKGGILVERVKALGKYQKTVLLFMIFMVLAFTVIYPVTAARVGFLHKNVILVPTQKDGNTIYSGEIQGKPASFTVSAHQEVTFQYGDKVYGPYTAKEDPTAIPKDHDTASSMTGVEILCGSEIFFRGVVSKIEDFWWLINEDGTSANVYVEGSAGNGMMTDENGNVIDPMEPSLSTILDMMAGPELTHKGIWIAWFVGVLLCLITAVSILFAHELFRLSMTFRLRNPENAEPSLWEIACRYIVWTLQPICAMVLFIIGLQ